MLSSGNQYTVEADKLTVFNDSGLYCFYLRMVLDTSFE